MIDFLNKIIDFDYRFKIKIKLFIPMLILIGVSLVLLNYSNTDKSFLFYSQIRWAIFGSLLIIIFSYIKIDFIYKHSYKLYVLLFILLLLTLIFGNIVNNSQRWLSIGFSFQPSEIGKLLFIFFIAKLLVNRPKRYSDFKVMCLILAQTLLIVFLILKQPDLGTALVYLFTIFPMMVWSGVKFINIIILISPIISFLISFIYEFTEGNLVDLNETYFFILFAIWILFITFIVFKKYKFTVLSGSIILANLLITTFTKIFIKKIEGHYWLKRITAYLDPLKHKNDLAYQINSSYDAIGSGGFLGKGLGNGMLTEFKMMPIYESDFIVSALAEQFGLISILMLLALLGYFFYWLVTYLDKCINKFEQLILVGFCSVWFFHFFVNLCIVSGIFPVTGLPFPFLSYGGTHFLTNCIMLAIANRIISEHISN